MTDGEYAVVLTRSAARALAQKLPLDGVHSTRLMREWRVLYVIDDDARTVTVRSIAHRRDAYRTH